MAHPTEKQLKPASHCNKNNSAISPAVEPFSLRTPTRDRGVGTLGCKSPHLNVNSRRSSGESRGRVHPLPIYNNNGIENHNESTRRKRPNYLVIFCFKVVSVFAVLCVAIGLLYWRYSADETAGVSGTTGGAEKPRIFNDYYVDTFEGTNVLSSGESLVPDEYASSPSGEFRVGLSLDGDFVLEQVRVTDHNETQYANIWRAGIEGGTSVYLQQDGNLLVRNQTRQTLWKSGTHQHNDATLIVDDGGRIGMRYEETLIWMEGIPQRTYRGPSSEDLQLPVRGAFYYAWYPQTWKVSSGAKARFEPDVGYYVSGDPVVIDSHIDQLEYGNIDVGIVSWFGPGTNLDIARITNIMDRSLELNATIKWTIYYEDEWKLDPDHAQLQADLEYIKKWFAWHPTYAHVDGKPLIYVWNEGDCDVVDRWMKATNGEWFVIPKLFSGYRDCPIQPNNWHQYGPASAYQRFRGHSVSISPGFWHAAENVSRLPRLHKEEWCDNVFKMVETGEPWQLITTFNEAGEGTGIESSAANWPSESGYGVYLDCLHDVS